MSAMENESAAAPAENTEPKKDLVAEFKRQPAAERLLAIAAVVVIAGWIIAKGWNLFGGSWFWTTALVGAAGVITLIVLDMMSIKLMDAKVRTYVVIVLAVLPAVGYVIDQLRHLPSALTLAGAIAMGLAGVKITTRENIIKK